MPNIVGVDGCPAGWIALIEQTEGRRITAHVFLTFRDLTVARDAAVIAIDIPIGLTDAGPRDCDERARRHLGPKRGTSVFPAPVRSAVTARTYAEAKAASIRAQKKGISQQAFAIYRKIRAPATLFLMMKHPVAWGSKNEEFEAAGRFVRRFKS